MISNRILTFLDPVCKQNKQFFYHLTSYHRREPNRKKKEVSGYRKQYQIIRMYVCAICYTHEEVRSRVRKPTE